MRARWDPDPRIYDFPEIAQPCHRIYNTGMDQSGANAARVGIFPEGHLMAMAMAMAMLGKKQSLTVCVWINVSWATGHGMEKGVTDKT